MTRESFPLGVDIGTTYTAAALWRDGRVHTAPLGNRANAIPSVLFVRENGDMLVGEPAALRGVAEPERQAREFKRRMGDDVPILVAGQGFSALELTARVLRWVVDRVTEAQGGPPSHVVLTHPALWGPFRQGQLTAAALGAGLRDVGLLAEPVAAATWYAAQDRVEPNTLIGVYDFGGGTFDASVVRKTTTGMEIVGEPGGDDSIGGIDFDHALFRHVLEAAGVDLAAFDRTDGAVASALGQLFNSVVEAKEALSADVEAVVAVVLPGVTRQVLITRADFESLIRTRVLGTVGAFEQVTRRAGIDPSGLHTVLLVGGSSRIPLVRQLLTTELGVRVALDAHPKHTVSLGAAIAAAPRGMIAPAPPRPGPPPPHRPTPPHQYQSPAAPPPGYPPAPAQPQGYPPAPAQPLGYPSVPVPPPARRPASPQLTPPPPALPPPARGPEPVVAEPVDLAGSGLTAATDVPVVVGAVPIIDLSEQFGPRATVVRTSDDTGRAGFGRGRLAAVLVLVVIVAVVGVVAVLATRKPGSGAASGASRATTSAPGTLPTAGTVRLDGQPATPPQDDADAMRAVAALPDGDLVAVGVTLHLMPRAWVRHGGAQWTVAANPPAEANATMEDVVATSSGVVAVGWTGNGAARRAAVWTSHDGSTWRLLGPAGDFAAGTGITELTALTVTADNRLLAVGVDRKSDQADGDMAVFTSTDGTAWTRVTGATGLSGPGPQTVRRLTRTADGHLVAIGAALVGAHEGPTVWTSSGGVTWQVATYAPDDASATLLAIVAEPDGSLLSCGSIGSADQPGVACWIEHDPAQPWQRWQVASPNTPPVYLYDLIRTGDATVVVGAGRSDTAVDAASWTAALQAS